MMKWESQRNKPVNEGSSGIGGVQQQQQNRRAREMSPSMRATATTK